MSQKRARLLELADRVETATVEQQREMLIEAAEAVCRATLSPGAPSPAWLEPWDDLLDVGGFLDAAMTLVPEGWRVSALEQDWRTGLWRAQLGPKPSEALVSAFDAGRTVGWETVDAGVEGRGTIAAAALALTAAALRAQAATQR